MSKSVKKRLSMMLAVIIFFGGVHPTLAKASTDNTIQNAILINENGSYSGTAPEEEEVYYRLNLQETGIVTFTLNVFQDNGSDILLYDNGYEKIQGYYAYYDGNRDCAYKKIKFYLCAGTYYIKLGNLYKNTSYSFSLNFQKGKESFPESQSNRNDILAQAKRISLEKKYYGLIGDGDYQDFYSFNMPFSGNISITHFNYTEEETGYYEILNSEGNRVCSFSGDYDYNKGYAYDKDTVELDKGTYYLKVYEHNGAYKFSINAKPDEGTVDYGMRSKSKATIRLKKSDDVTGYIVQYSTSDKFSKKSTKSKTVKGTTVKLSGLSKSKTYYVRVRCYKQWNGKNYYGDFGNTYTLWP